jgi:hypothetical protein
MPKQWRLLFDELALSGSVMPLWPAVKALCDELKRQGFLSEAQGRYRFTPYGIDFYKSKGGDYVTQALAHQAKPQD